jgi:chromosome partitioning protein
VEERVLHFKRRVLANLTGYGLEGESRLAKHIEKLQAGSYPVQGGKKLYTADDSRQIRAVDAPWPLPRFDRPEVLAFFYSKGGVGKTTICANIGVTLAAAGNRVLLIDTDPQASLSLLFDVDVDQEIYTLGDAVEAVIHDKPADFRKGLIRPIKDLQLDLLPADNRLVWTDMLMVQAQYREKLVEQVFICNQALLEEYDFVLIDTPPSVNSLSFSAVAASNRIISVVQLSKMAIKASGNLFKLARELKKGTGRVVPITFIPNMLHGGKPHTRSTLDIIRASIDSESSSKVGITATVIPEYVGLARPKGHEDGQKTLLEAEPLSLTTQKFIELSREIETLAMLDRGDENHG